MFFDIPVNSVKVSVEHTAVNGVRLIVTISTKSDMVSQVGAILDCRTIRFISQDRLRRLIGAALAGGVLLHRFRIIVSKQFPGRRIRVTCWAGDEPSPVAIGMSIPLGLMRVMTGGAWVGISRVSPFAGNKSLYIGQVMRCAIYRVTVGQRHPGLIDK